MRKSTFTKALFTTIAFSLCLGAMAAGDEQASDSVQYQLTLADYLKIVKTTENPSSNVTFGNNYSTITIDDAMTGGFSVISNAATKDIYLQGTCPVAGALPLYSRTSNPTTDLHLVFTKVGGVAEAGDVTNITGASVAPESNKDAISFKITPTITHAEDPETGITPTWNNTKKQVQYTMKNGTGSYQYVIGGSADANTFSTHDSSGTYQATLTLTSTSL